MAASTLFFLFISIPPLAFAINSHPPRPPPPPNSVWRRASAKNIPAAGYYNVSAGGGAMLTDIPVTYPMGLGEPINVILSANSDAAVLVDQSNNGGLRNYFNSFGFSSECLGQHSGSDQMANLGDGNGYRNETAVIRWDYGDPTLGTCEETIQGGNHFRYWVQDGSQADSGAVFMALSYELPIAQQHDIIPNGYNLARDWLVGNATSQSQIVPTANLTNTSSYSGSTSAGGYTYQTNVTYLPGLLPNTSNGINHYQSVASNGTNAVDGLVALLVVRITTSPKSSSASKTSPHPWTLPFPSVLALALLASIAPLSLSL